MKKGEFNKIIRDKVAQGMNVLTFPMKPTHKKQVEAVIRETVKSIADDIQKVEHSNEDTKKLERLKEIDAQINQLEQERIKILS